MIAKILVAHDGTEISNRAFERATEFAKAFKTEILLLHVIQDIPVPSWGLAMILPLITTIC
jgi:nucleotide-binding universal stress UspA family protein